MTVDILLFTDNTHILFVRPAGAYAVATTLRAAGYSVQVVDHFLLLGVEKTLAIIDKFVGPNTLFVGFGTTFMNPTYRHLKEAEVNNQIFTYDGYWTTTSNRNIYVDTIAYRVPISDPEMDAIKNRITSINSKTKLVIGGSKANDLRQSQMDVFIIGYAEQSVVDFAKYLQGKNPFFHYRTTQAGQMIVDHDIDAKNYNFSESGIRFSSTDLIDSTELLPLEVARGCIFKCKFCSFRLIGKKKNDYTKTFEALYSELMYNYDNFGVTRYTFVDDTLNESIYKLDHILRVVKKLPFKLEIASYIRHDLIHTYPEMADMLSEIGLKAACFGIESLNHETGKLIGKGLHPEKTKELLTWLRNEKKWKNNILMYSGFIIGLPKDTVNTVTTWTEEISDPSYPLDSVYIIPLMMISDSTRLKKSEFELNYEKYGYTYETGSTVRWKNKDWTYDSATAFAKKYTLRNWESKRNTVTSFASVALRSYGYSWEQIFAMREKDYNWHNIFQTNIIRTNTYYDNLIGNQNGPVSNI